MNSYNRLTAKMALNLAAPHTWVASVIPALFGVLFCRLNGLNLTLLQEILLIVACILMQSSVNTFNDYVDFVKGNDSAEDNVEESDAVLIYNHINPKDVLILGIVYLIAGCSLGALACSRSGALPLTIGTIGAIIVVLYSCGPCAISYLPLGEIVSGFVMGVLIPLGIAATADGNLHFKVFIFALPLFLGIGLIMMTNNGCDIEKDRAANRHTLPTILGREKTVQIYHILVAFWMFSIIALSVVYLKKYGIVVLIPMVLGRKPFQRLLDSKLIPEKRVEQMKGIVLGNIIGNGGYLLVMIIKIIVG